VLILSLLREPERFERSAMQLKRAGIWPTAFLAADAECLSPDELSQGCYSADNDHEHVAEKCTSQGRAGHGCVNRGEQAIAESHHRALLAASKRSADWTVILEDDAVPVRPERWSEAFKAAWAMVPSHVKLIRLSWCIFPGDHRESTASQEDFADAGDFHLVGWIGYNPSHQYDSGGCTTGYMVHKDILPDMLELFPCCCALDCCLQNDFYQKPAAGSSVSRGLSIMLNLDAWGSQEFSADFTSYGLVQNGVFVQDARRAPSTRMKHATKDPQTSLVSAFEALNLNVPVLEKKPNPIKVPTSSLSISPSKEASTSTA
jgi:hypothetical protein